MTEDEYYKSILSYRSFVIGLLYGYKIGILLNPLFRDLTSLRAQFQGIFRRKHN